VQVVFFVVAARAGLCWKELPQQLGHLCFAGGTHALTNGQTLYLREYVISWQGGCLKILENWGITILKRQWFERIDRKTSKNYIY
jgi:hypothetical protein